MSRAAGRDSERLGDFEHQVGLTELPTFGELWLRRQVRGIAFGRSGLGPLVDSINLRVGQTAFIVKCAKPRFRLPGRHSSTLDNLRQEARPLGGVFVSRSGNGPTSPGRWQPAQFFQRIGAISLQ